VDNCICKCITVPITGVGVFTICRACGVVWFLLALQHVIQSLFPFSLNVCLANPQQFHLFNGLKGGSLEGHSFTIARLGLALFSLKEMARRLSVPRRGAGLSQLFAQQNVQSRFWYVYELLLHCILLISCTNPLRKEPIIDIHVYSSSCVATGAPAASYPTIKKTSPSSALLTDKKSTSPSIPPIAHPSTSSVLRAQNRANMATVTETHSTPLSKPNVGVFTDPEHKLWIAESGPSLESVQKGEGLKEGEVTIGIKSTGICGYISPPRTRFHTEEILD